MLEKFVRSHETVTLFVAVILNAMVSTMLSEKSSQRSGVRVVDVHRISRCDVDRAVVMYFI